MIKEFDPVIYPRKVWVTTGNLDEIISKFKYEDGESLSVAKTGYYGVCCDGVKHIEQDSLGVLLYFRKLENPAHAMHEAIHAANAIFHDLGIVFSYGEDEHYAYFVEWICRCILSMVNIGTTDNWEE